MIPSSTLSNTDDIERGNAQCGSILTRSPRISDESMENILIGGTNDTLEWMRDLEHTNQPMLHIVEKIIANETFQNLQKSSKERSEQLVKKRLEYDSLKMKEWKITKQYGWKILKGK